MSARPKRRCPKKMWAVACALAFGVLVPGIQVSAAASTSRSDALSVACPSNVRYGSLPTWARAGFSPPGQPMPHVVGVRGDITAILWAKRDALLAPPSPDRLNKILWVSRVPDQPLSDLQIDARRLVGSSPVGPTEKRVVIGGPGPSGIDMPSAGCWQFTLRWSGHLDTVDLQYTANH